MNPFNPSSTDNVSPPVQGGNSADLLIDLVSEEDPLAHPLAQPVTENVVDKESDPLDFLDQAVEYHSAKSDCQISSKETTYSDSSAEQYLKCLKSLAGPSLVCYAFVHIDLNHYKYSCFAHPRLYFNFHSPKIFSLFS